MIAILHDIRSLHNVGSIFRTADAAGVEKLYLCGITPSPLDAFGRVRQPLAKVALGAEKTVPWDASARSAQEIARLIKRLKKDGYKIFAVEQARNSIPYHRLNVKGQLSNVVLIFGNEVKGLPTTLLKKCDKILEIPMYGRKESLNVAVAFGIVVFALRNTR